MKRKSSSKTAAAGDPLAELERKLDALTLRVDAISAKPIAQVLAKHPAMLGVDPAGQLMESWRSIRDRTTSGASVARVYLARVVVTPWAGAAVLAGGLALVHASLPYLLMSFALVGAAIATSSEKAPST